MESHHKWIPHGWNETPRYLRGKLNHTRRQINELPGSENSIVVMQVNEELWQATEMVLVGCVPCTPAPDNLQSPPINNNRNHTPITQG